MADALYRLPDGTATFDRDEHYAAWTRLCDAVEEITGGDVLGRDPSIIVGQGHRCWAPSAELPVWIAERMADIAAELARLRGERTVLAGLLREAQGMLTEGPGNGHLFRGYCPDHVSGADERDRDCPACALLSRIDAALSPAGEDLLTGESNG